MKNFFYLPFLLAQLIAFNVAGQTKDSLLHTIEKIIASKNAEVGVSIVGNKGKDTVLVNGDGHFPLQSVFKLHIALALLSAIDLGKFSLTQKIKIEEKDLLPTLYSPIRDAYPHGGTLTISQILEYTVSQSDNVGCEILLKLIGGPAVVEDFFTQRKFKDVSIKINEQVMQANWDRQFENWTTPKAATEVLSSFFSNERRWLSKKSHAFIWKLLKETETGPGRLKGQLLESTILAHKTGSSGTNAAGITAAVNDIGIVFLPNGQYFFISVFVTNSRENADVNEKIIADICKAAWDYFTATTL